MVGEPHPSKQGLKPADGQHLSWDNSRVGEPHPSKQGLKQSKFCLPEKHVQGSASPIHQNKD